MIRDKAYVINLDEYSDIGTHWILLNLSKYNVTYCDSFGVERIQKEIYKEINNMNIQTIIFRIQAFVSVMCGFFCIEVIDCRFKIKNVTDFPNLFSQNNLKNDDIILNYSKNR